jgi:hypothetical protein
LDLGSLRPFIAHPTLVDKRTCGFHWLPKDITRTCADSGGREWLVRNSKCSRARYRVKERSKVLEEMSVPGKVDMNSSPFDVLFG